LLRLHSKVSAQLDEDGFAICPDCSTRINCGPGGIGNLEQRHRGKKTCIEARAKRDKASIVAAPPPVSGTTAAVEQLKIHSVEYKTPAIRSTEHQEHGILDRLRESIQRLPATVPEALESDIFAVFSGEPAAFMDSNVEPNELWEHLDSTFNNVIGWKIICQGQRA